MPEKPINPDYSAFDTKSYGEKIVSPSANPQYFSRFVRPVIEDALDKTPINRNIKFLDLACGNAAMIKNIESMPDFQRIAVTGVDISKETLREAEEDFRKNHPRIKIKFVRADLSSGRLKKIAANSQDAASALNAMAYVPEKILAGLRYALKPGAQAVVNFMIPDKNPGYLEMHDAFASGPGKMDIAVQPFRIENCGLPLIYDVMMFDYSNCGHPEYSRLGQQIFFLSEADIYDFVEHSGLRIARHDRFRFRSHLSGSTVFEMLTLTKPENEISRDGRIQQIISETSGKIR